jgi:hypothetical protein
MMKAEKLIPKATLVVTIAALKLTVTVLLSKPQNSHLILEAKLVKVERS